MKRVLLCARTDAGRPYPRDGRDRSRATGTARAGTLESDARDVWCVRPGALDPVRSTDDVRDALVRTARDVREERRRETFANGLG